MNLIQAMTDGNLLGPAFGHPGTWRTWRVFLRAVFGLSMSVEEAAIFTRHTGRTTPPTAQAKEAWAICGRRGGKSRIAATEAVYLACFRDYRTILAPGERGTLPIIAADRRQARNVFRYVNGLLDGCPMLARLVASRTAESVELTNNVTIEVHTASFRSIRGYTVIGAVCDEIAYWRSDDSANPDREIIAALRPAMATVPGALLVAISSPYARRGVLWDAYRRHYGQDGDVLVWQAPTRAMNPGIDERVIAEAYAQDESAAAAEYGAEFRRDIESFISREVVEACVVTGRHELPRLSETFHVGFVDPSGGSADSMTLAVCHRDPDGTAVVDCVREVRPPFSPETVVADFAAVLRSYGISMVTGDRYGGEWPRERFREYGITYNPCERAKSELYALLLPALNSRRVQLLDHARLIAQLCGLERRTAWGGRDSIDHGPGGHDDVANAVAGAVAALTHQGHGLFLIMQAEYEKLVAAGKVRPEPPWRAG
jgi:hypothetical protein